MAAGMRRCTDRLVTRRDACSEHRQLSEFLHKPLSERDTAILTSAAGHAKHRLRLGAAFSNVVTCKICQTEIPIETAIAIHQRTSRAHVHCAARAKCLCALTSVLRNQHKKAAGH
jgi:hypothetical protein